MPPDSYQPTVQQMFATLLGEIATLRKQNVDQQRQLEHLRSTTSLLLERDNTSLQISRKVQFKHLPLEIREMIWELALPIRLLGFEGIFQEGDIPTALSVPAVAHVCQESRRIAMSRRYFEALSHEETRLPGSPLWRLKHTKSACWTWFTPYKDALLINPETFHRDGCRNNHVLARLAEHVILEDPSMWHLYYDPAKPGVFCPDYSIGHARDVLVELLTPWVPGVMPWGIFSHPIPFPVCNLRTIDFALSKVTKIDQNYPPDFVHRLFGGDDVKVVDLRDRKAVLGMERALQCDLPEAMIPNEFYHWRTDLETSLDIYRAVADEFSRYVRPRLLKKLADYYHRATSGVLSPKPPPFKDGKLNMEVTWVKEFCERIEVRLVHVFVRAEGISKVDW